MISKWAELIKSIVISNNLKIELLKEKKRCLLPLKMLSLGSRLNFVAMSTIYIMQNETDLSKNELHLNILKNRKIKKGDNPCIFKSLNVLGKEIYDE